MVSTEIVATKYGRRRDYLDEFQNVLFSEYLDAVPRRTVRTIVQDGGTALGKFASQNVNSAKRLPARLLNRFR